LKLNPQNIKIKVLINLSFQVKEKSKMW